MIYLNGPNWGLINLAVSNEEDSRDAHELSHMLSSFLLLSLWWLVLRRRHKNTHTHTHTHSPPASTPSAVDQHNPPLFANLTQFFIIKVQTPPTQFPPFLSSQFLNIPIFFFLPLPCVFSSGYPRFAPQSSYLFGALLPWFGTGEWYPLCRTMRPGKGNQEEEEYEEEDFGNSKKQQGPSSAPNTNNTNKGR